MKGHQEIYFFHTCAIPNIIWPWQQGRTLYLHLVETSPNETKNFTKTE
jgi:hypothetical protein